MRILVIAPKLMYPVLSGAEVRMYNLFAAVAAHHEVHLISQLREEASREAQTHLTQLFSSAQFFRVDPTEGSAVKRPLWRRIEEIWMPPADYFDPDGYSPLVKEAIEHTIVEKRIESVYVFGWGMRKYLIHRTDLPVVFDIVDNPEVYLRRRISEFSTPMQKARATKEWLVMRRMIAHDFNRLADIVLVSGDDAEKLHALCKHPNLTVIPNGVNAQFFAPGPVRETNRPVLIFTGVMNYGPNVSAMLHFCRNILPLIKAQVPETALYIVGRHTHPDIVALGNEGNGVTVTGEVEDIRPYFDRALIYVSPIISGSGIKNKILEAWAMERPVVATSMSCEGINVQPGLDILVADSPQDFAASTLRLIKDRSLRETLAKNGRSRVLSEYSWESQAQKVEQVLRRGLKNLAREKPVAAPRSIR